MNYLEQDICERIELAIGRLNEIDNEDICLFECPYNKALKTYFSKVSDFILYVYDVYNIINTSNELSLEYLKRINTELYKDIVCENYKESFANPDYAVECLGEEYGSILSFLYAEIRSIIAYIYEGKLLNFIATVELFLEIYSMFTDTDAPSVKYIKEAIYYHMYDYADVFVAERTYETISPDNTFATDIIMNRDLTDLRYLYAYGEYISDNEIKTATYLNGLDEASVKSMARTYVEGFIKGFETMRIDLSPKKTVNIRYSIGQERMVRYAIEMFRDYGLLPIIFRYPVSRINRKLTMRVGYTATPANKQYEYDHRMDESLFFDKGFVERKLEVIKDTYTKNKELALEYAGPAVIEVFGENPFKPSISKHALKLSEKQQTLSVEYASKSAEISNTFIPRDKYSFTIIAYPVPEIGDNFEEIYDEIVKVNTLDNELYRGIQQSIIDELDKSEYVQVLGKGDNKTDIKVMLHKLKDASKETNFENCLADVNIPVGEVFTSPVLTGTEGVLNISQVYLNELKYTDLTLTFKDGKIVDYTCSNFQDEDANKAFIKENLMYNHDTLPIGEFAIGTNTTAYVMAHKFDIIYKLPILIVEKMGPHFAVGDTCYSYSEDSKLYNPDGKEIIAKENECSVLRKSEDLEEKKKAYFNCHTDITIPYEEIEAIYSVHPDGEKVAIIQDGR
ncbi:MAG: aminopeptidase, partial [Lachnospiraceae bacterium]|nr:aminopeptidase [Lachnospiraceae bacterium]